MRIMKEAIKSSPENIQLFVDSLSEEVAYSKYPGSIPFDGDVYDMTISYLDECFSVKDFPEIHNSLKLFNRITTARKVLDTLASIEVVWLLNHSDVSKDRSWAENRINPNFTKTKNFSDFLPVTLKFVSVGYTVAEYNGELRIGGHYRKESNDFGMSMKIKMNLKYATSDGFYSSVDDHSTDRFSDLDLESFNRKLEYKKITHVPFNSLYKIGEDLPLFRKRDNAIDPDLLASLVILAEKGNVLGSLVGIDGDGRKTEPWFRKGEYSTVVEIDGICVYDGRTGESKAQPRLLSVIRDEADKIPEGDIFLRTEYDIKVSVYNLENKLWCYQLGTLTIRKIKNDYCGTILKQKSLVQKYYFPDLELERLERNNVTIKEIQKDFEDSVKRKTTVLYKIGTDSFDSSVLSFLKEIKDVVLPEGDSSKFIFSCYVGEDKKDIYSSSFSSLLSLDEWKEFISEAEDYSYTSHVTEEFVFDLYLPVYIETRNKQVQIMEYSGSLSVELESKLKTNLYVDLKAKKLNTSLDRDYIPKKPVDRYANLEY